MLLSIVTTAAGRPEGDISYVTKYCCASAAGQSKGASYSTNGVEQVTSDMSSSVGLRSNESRNTPSSSVMSGYGNYQTTYRWLTTLMSDRFQCAFISNTSSPVHCIVSCCLFGMWSCKWRGKCYRSVLNCHEYPTAVWRCLFANAGCFLYSIIYGGLWP